MYLRSEIFNRSALQDKQTVCCQKIYSFPYLNFYAGWEGSIVVQRIRESEGAFGFNADNETFEDLYKAGVIDPTKVARIALENAASVAGLMLMTEATIVEKPKPKPAAPPMPPGGDMY